MLRRYSEIVKLADLALLRIIRASVFVTTNRRMTSRLRLGAIFGLPTRFGIASLFVVLLIPSVLGRVKVALRHPLANGNPGKAKILPKPDARQGRFSADLCAIPGLLEYPGR
jgi:hypothetical protein